MLGFRLYLESLGLASATINPRLAAVRRLAYEAADSGLLSPELAAGIRRVKSVNHLGQRSGNWLTIDQWLAATDLKHGQIFRAVSRHGSCWGRGISENVVWYVVRECAKRLSLEHIVPHDLRRTCAKLCHSNGGELEQIQFFLGHASVLTTERYLGSKQNLEEPINDRFGPLNKHETPRAREPDIA